MEKLRLPILEDCSNSAISTRGHMSGIPVPPPRFVLVQPWHQKSILPVEAVIAAAAEEAITLAKGAAKVARDAALMGGKYNSVKPGGKLSVFLSDSESIPLKRAQLIKTEGASFLEDSIPAETGLEENHAMANFDDTAEEREPTLEETKQLQDEFSWSVAVRSNDRTLKKNRKIKVTERVAASGEVSSKSGYTSRKKHASALEVAYSDPLRYLRGMTRTFKLLTAKEEMILSAGLQELLKLERLRGELAEPYGCQPSFRQWAAAAGFHQKTMRSLMNYGIMCKDKMIKSNLRLVISISKNYQGAGMNLQDVGQEGCRGLVRGTEKLDASKGFKFSTYAHWWIKQPIKKALSDQSRTIRLPFHIVEATYRVKEARKQLYSKNGRYPTNEEVAVATGLSMMRLMAVLQAPKPPKSLDQKVGVNLDLKSLILMQKQRRRC